MPLRLDTDDWWPSDLRGRVFARRETLLTNNYMERLIEAEPFKSIAEDLETFISKHRIVGYHCTKESEPGYFETHGLRILDRKRHQTEFVGRFGSHFSPEELTQMQEAWETYFSWPQDQGSAGQVWFCLATDQVVDSGAERFFEYFGGEAIYMPLTHHATIAAKLRSIGNPVVVEVSINPKELQVFSTTPCAINALSLFHKRQNAEACVHGREGYLRRDVSPSEILGVIPRDRFFATYSRC